MYVKNPAALTQLIVDGIKTKIEDAINEVIAANTNGAALTPVERRKGVTVGKERKPFNDHYFTNKNNYPDLKPSQTVVTEAQAEKHYFDHTKLEEIKNLGLKFVELVEDIQLNAEHFSFQFASKGRLAAKNGRDAGLPGADTFFNALDELFPQREAEEVTP